MFELDHLPGDPRRWRGQVATQYFLLSNPYYPREQMLVNNRGLQALMLCLSAGMLI